MGQPNTKEYIRISIGSKTWCVLSGKSIVPGVTIVLRRLLCIHRDNGTWAICRRSSNKNKNTQYNILKYIKGGSHDVIPKISVSYCCSGDGRGSDGTQPVNLLLKGGWYNRETSNLQTYDLKMLYSDQIRYIMHNDRGATEWSLDIFDYCAYVQLYLLVFLRINQKLRLKYGIPIQIQKAIIEYIG